MVEVTWAPGAFAADASQNVPANSPPIGKVISARANELTEGTPNTLVETTPTPTKEDSNTFQLDAATTVSTLLTLVYTPEGELALP